MNGIGFSPPEERDSSTALDRFPPVENSLPCLWQIDLRDWPSQGGEHFHLGNAVLR